MISRLQDIPGWPKLGDAYHWKLTSHGLGGSDPTKKWNLCVRRTSDNTILVSRWLKREDELLKLNDLDGYLAKVAGEMIWHIKEGEKIADNGLKLLRYRSPDDQEI